MPSSDWYYGFRKRHPELSIRKMSTSRIKLMNQPVVEKYFAEL